jgi:hypothetical protein
MHAGDEQEPIERGLSLVVDDLLTVRQRRDVDVVRLLRMKGLTVAQVAKKLRVSKSRVHQRRLAGEWFLHLVGTGQANHPNRAMVLPEAMADDTKLRDTVVYERERLLNALRIAGITTVGEARHFLASAARPRVRNLGEQGMALLSAAVGVPPAVQAKKKPTPKAQQVMVRKVFPPVPGGPKFERVVVKGKDASGRLILERAPFEDIDG